MTCSGPNYFIFLSCYFMETPYWVSKLQSIQAKDIREERASPIDGGVTSVGFGIGSELIVAVRVVVSTAS